MSNNQIQKMNRLLSILIDRHDGLQSIYSSWLHKNKCVKPNEQPLMIMCLKYRMNDDLVFFLY